MAFSNSRTQKEYIDRVAKKEGLKNLEVITGNVADYEFEKESFDRVVSIEVRHAPSIFTHCEATHEFHIAHTRLIRLRH